MAIFNKPFPVETSMAEGQQGGRSRSPSGTSGSIPRFRGMLICRRCELCGTRISFKAEADEKVILKCPACQREYIFRENIE